jgi:cellulose synthase/poly-beta-1,6-N-acetylglucosamine synthase-like glycosyltransferase
LLAQGLVSPGVFLAAEARARALGVGLDETLIASGVVDEETLYRGLARRWRIPYLDQPILHHVNELGALAAGVAALRADEADEGGPRYVLAPRGERLEATTRLFGRPGAVAAGATAMTSPKALREAAIASLGPRVARAAASSVDPRWRAQGGPTPSQVGVGLAFAVLVAFAAVVSGVWGDAASLALAFFFMLVVVVRATALVSANDEPPEAPALADRDLPRYAVVVAMHREENVVADLVDALDALDYPREKIEILLVLEEDDAPTREALARLALPPHMSVIVAPDGKPRTKPRALNVGLMATQAELLVVYDAEDRPDADQLRRAAARFAVGPGDLACLQARLAIDNDADGPLPALFALDYAGLFETMNPGLAALDWPMLLGGTSNHFRVDALRALGGWDAWNVTEDADLGLRLARSGWRVETLRSTTWEEAPVSVSAWLAQRRRWMKGWMQTLLAHSRDPVDLARRLGGERALSILGLLGGGLASCLLTPFFGVKVALDAQRGALLRMDSWLALAATSMCLTVLAAGPALALTAAARGALREGRPRLLFWLPLLPLYYLLLAWPAWRAAAELARHPHHWAKTRHGVAVRRRTPPRRREGDVQT